MSLTETIARFCGVELGGEEYRLTALGGKCIYIEGVRCVKSFSGSEIILGLKKSCLKITGEGLLLGSFCGGDAAIKGSVRVIERISC